MLYKRLYVKHYLLTFIILKDLPVYFAELLQLEKMFTQSFDYSIYHPDVVFIDNIRHIRTQ